MTMRGVLVGLVIGLTVGAASATAAWWWFERTPTNPYTELSERGVAFATKGGYRNCRTEVLDQSRQNRIFGCESPKATRRTGMVRAAVTYKGLTTFEKGAAPGRIEHDLRELHAPAQCVLDFRTVDSLERADSVAYLITYRYHVICD